MHPLESPIPALSPLDGGPRQLSNEPNDVAPNSRHNVTQTVQSQRRFQKQSHRTLRESIYKATSTKRIPAKHNGQSLLLAPRSTTDRLLVATSCHSLQRRCSAATIGPVRLRGDGTPSPCSHVHLHHGFAIRLPRFMLQIDLAVRFGRTKLSHEFWTWMRDAYHYTYPSN